MDVKMLTKNDKIHDPAQHVSWLLWLDTLERLDTILLEIRHHQVNLIHSLRSAELYEILHYEEFYIWGSYAPTVGQNSETKSWLSLLQTDINHIFISDLCAKWIIQFPSFDATADSSSTPPDHNSTRKYYDTKYRKDSQTAAINIVKKQLEQGKWKSDQRRLYHALRGLQILKAEILFDKLTLCRWGARLSVDLHSQSSAGNFLLIRSAIMRKMHSHIQRLEDLRSQFEAALDLGIQDHPKPLIRRRREQGIYSSYLSERCDDLRDLVASYLLTAIDEPDIKLHGSMYMHRWNHSAISDMHLMQSNLDYWSDENQNSIDIYNTSFFMPDRPDLQSVMAHEVAHAAIFHAMGDFSPQGLNKKKGDFPLLIRQISICLQEHGIGNTDYTNDPRYEFRSLIKELACDIIAAVVKGPAFVFALMQEIIGLDLDILFSSPLRSIDLTLDSFLTQVGLAELEIPGFEWYLRLMITCTVVESICTDNDPLATRLLDGVRSLSDDLLNTIEQLGARNIVTAVNQWRGLTKQLCFIIRRSRFHAGAITWRENRAEFTNEEAPGELIFNLRYPSSARKLPDHVRERLISALIKLKQRDGRLLDPFKNPLSKIELESAFCRLYLSGEDHVPGQLYRYLYDIPWQSAMLRACDFLHPNKGIASRKSSDKEIDWLLEMHLDGAPGRHLYQIALEFSYWLHISAPDTMQMVIRLVDSALTDLKDENNEKITISLTKWRYGDGTFQKDLLTNILNKYINDNDYIIKDDLTDLVRTMPAENVYEMHIKKIPAETTHGKAISGRFSSYANAIKINSLYNDIKAIENSHIKSLLAYLKGLSKNKDVCNTLFDAMESFPETNQTASLSPLVMLDRLVVSSDVCAKLPWDYLSQPLPKSCFSKSSASRLYAKTLGRYDAIGLTINEPPARSHLPRINFLSEKLDKNSEKISFFERHELALAIRVKLDKKLPKITFNSDENSTNEPKHPNTPEKNQDGFIAFLCITLAARSSRLDFLYRLISDVKNTSSLSTHVGDEDLVLLSEGWGDIVIAFKGNDKSAIDRVFAAQYAFYDDFVVDQTELILATPALGYVIDDQMKKEESRAPFKQIQDNKEDNNKNDSDIILYQPDNYSIIIRVRLQGGSNINKNFINKLIDYKKNYLRNKNCFSMARTPGRTDFTFHFYCPLPLFQIEKDEHKFSQIYQQLAEADEVLTIISASHINSPASTICDKYNDCRERLALNSKCTANASRGV
jgi:hypothetical protein